MTLIDYSAILNFYSKFVTLSDIDKALLIDKLEVLHVKKNTVFVKENTVSNYVYFVNKGKLRGYCLRGGDIITTQFYFSGEYCSSYISFLTRKKGDLNIECIEDAELLVLSYEDVQELYKVSPAFNTFGRRLSEMLYIDYYERTISLLQDNAKERYLRLLNKRPEIVKSMSSHLIASYIGVAPETLSRIKKSIFNH